MIIEKTLVNTDPEVLLESMAEAVYYGWRVVEIIIIPGDGFIHYTVKIEKNEL